MAITAKLSPTHKTWNLLTPANRRSAMALLGLMLIGMMLEAFSVGLVIPAIALLTQRDFADNYPMAQSVLQVFGRPGQKDFIVSAIVLLVGIYLIKTLFLAVLAWRQTGFAFRIQAQISQRLFSVYLCQPYSFHLNRNSAELIRNVTGEVGLFIGNGILPSMVFLTESLVIVGLCGLLLIIEPMGALIVGSVLGTAAWGFHHLTRRRLTRWGEARLHHEGLRIQHLQQGLGSAKEVKLLGRENEFLERYQIHNEHTAHVLRLQVFLQQLPRLWLELFAITGFAILILTMLAQGRALDTVLPALGMVAAAAFRLMPSVNRVLGAVQTLRYALPVIDVLYEEISLATPIEAGTRPPEMSFCTRIELKRVNYVYPGATEPTLRNLSIEIKCGESVGFVGTSGAGKSTLVDILLGLLTPNGGEVLVDGKNIQANMRSWQDQIGYVPQSIYLTDDTLRRNVGFGLSDKQIADTAIQRAVRAAQLEGFVSGLPDGLETIVGERGVRISGGERQRIGIARALYHDPAVLVLDEATSALDIGTEHEVMQAVRALHGKKTVLIVAHRLSTVEHCDKIYRLEQGSVVETVANHTSSSTMKNFANDL
jgi:ATP-binding cassette, subfamily B, bacterial PglK